MENGDHLFRRSKEDNVYKRLQDQSLEMIQQLSGNRWTDFNEHDPGVTIMDALNYVLYDLCYQTNFSFDEYLAGSSSGINLGKSGLFAAHTLFKPAVITVRDYEELFLNTVPGIRKCEVKMERGYYQVWVELEKGFRFEDINLQIRAVYHRNRNLCENLERIVPVEKIKKQDKRRSLPDIRYEENPVMPFHTNRLNAKYYSVQHEFPDCYGINEKGLPPGAPKERQAQALQLKGYLLIFDYLMFAVGEQIRQISRLLELSDKTPDRFRGNFNVEDLDRLLDKEKWERNSIFDPDRPDDQKSFWLDFLDVLYGEDTARLSLHLKDRKKRNKFRADLIRFFSDYHAHRSRSFNVTDPTMESMPEIKKLALQLSGNKHKKESPSVRRYIRGNYHVVIQKVLIFYLVEHILLAPGNKVDDSDHNQLTVVISDMKGQPEEREFYLRLLEERLPAHLNVTCLWLDMKEMYTFETVYFRWRKAWADGSPEQIIELSEEMREFIQS